MPTPKPALPQRTPVAPAWAALDEAAKEVALRKRQTMGNVVGKPHAAVCHELDGTAQGEGAVKPGMPIGLDVNFYATASRSGVALTATWGALQ